jgi:adenylate cyclase
MLGKLRSLFKVSSRENGADGENGAGGNIAGKIFGFLFKSLERMVGFALLIGFLIVYVKDPEPVQQLRLAVFDFFQNVKPREIPAPGKSQVTIIDLDEKSLAEIGQWPWPRSIVAKMVSNLTQMGAAVVAFDIFFPEPDRMNPDGVVASLAGLDAETRTKLLALPSNDQALANTIKKSRVILGQAGYWEGRGVKAGPPVKKSVAFLGPKPHPYLLRFPDMVRNVPVIEKAASGHGVVSLEPEIGNILRRVPTLFVYNHDPERDPKSDNLYPALAIEMLRVAHGRKTLAVRTNAAGVDSIGIVKGLVIRTDSHGRVWPYFSKSDKAKYVSARDVLAGTVNPALIKGKLTIIGTSAAGMLDIRATPTERVMPGVEVHAQLIETALSGSYLQRPNFINAAELMLIAIGGLLMIWLVPWVGALWTIPLSLFIVGGSAGTSWYLFSEKLMLFDSAYTVVSILILYLLHGIWGFAKEEAQKRQVRGQFSHYLSPAMVDKLADDPTRLQLGGEMREMTMLFCDVRGFTTISEMYDAQGLTRLINKLLTPLTGVILDRQGTVDKYMGDCIMAFWNAPLDDEDHARNACISALEMNAKMGPLNEQIEADAKEEGHDYVPLKIGTGVNSGQVVVGNMGSDQRFDYSVLGDNVNLASRLEGQCKTYVVDIVIGENTLAHVEGLATLELDLIKVKGKTEAVRIFTLLGDETMKAGNAYQSLSGTHQELLDSYRSQDWAQAREKIAACRQLMDGFELDGLYDVFAERIDEYEANPPGSDWDGVYEATSK